MRNQDVTALEYARWEEIDDGVFEGDQTKVSQGNVGLLKREQERVLRKTYEDLDALVNILGFPVVSWGLSVMAENPVPGGPDFSSWYELRLLSSFPERWDWITRSGDGMWELWTDASLNARKGWVGTPLRTRADDYNQPLLDPLGIW